MTEEQNKEVVKKLIEEAIIKGNLDVVKELVTEDMEDKNPFPGQPEGLEGQIFHIKTLRTSFPGQKVEYSLFADGDTVVEEWRGMGENTGPFLNQPATGKYVDYSGITIFELKDGKIISRRSYADSMVLLKQLGLIPNNH